LLDVASRGVQDLWLVDLAVMFATDHRWWLFVRVTSGRAGSDLVS
jgi:hypothetical protein